MHVVYSPLLLVKIVKLNIARTIDLLLTLKENT